MNMGLTAERVQRKYGVIARRCRRVRPAQPSERARARKPQGKFDEEIVPVEVETATPAGNAERSMLRQRRRAARRYQRSKRWRN